MPKVLCNVKFKVYVSARVEIETDVSTESLPDVY